MVQRSLIWCQIELTNALRDLSFCKTPGLDRNPAPPAGVGGFTISLLLCVAFPYSFFFFCRFLCSLCGWCALCTHPHPLSVYHLITKPHIWFPSQSCSPTVKCNAWFRQKPEKWHAILNYSSRSSRQREYIQSTHFKLVILKSRLWARAGLFCCFLFFWKRDIEDARKLIY